MITHKQRSSAEYARIYGSAERVEWVHGLPCENCGRMGRTINGHTESGGMSRKGDYRTIVALCSSIDPPGCHEKQHQHGWSALPRLDQRWKRQVAAAATERAWLASLNGEE